MNTLCVVTNFGCSYDCPYCLTKRLHVDDEDSADSLGRLRISIEKLKPDRIRITGIGDPLNDFEKHSVWWKNLFNYTECLPVEVETAYLQSKFASIHRVNKMIFHPAHKDEDLSVIKRYGAEKITVEYVVDDTYFSNDFHSIRRKAAANKNIDEVVFIPVIRSSQNTTINPTRGITLMALLYGKKYKLWSVDQHDYTGNGTCETNHFVYFFGGAIYDEKAAAKKLHL